MPRLLDLNIDDGSIQKSHCVLTVIIPVRSSSSRDVCSRLEYVVNDRELRSIESEINFLVVDDGSLKNESEALQKQSSLLGMSYIYLDTGNTSFSIARARNAGVLYSNSTYILFMDVDLHTYGGFYVDLLNEIRVRRLKDHANDFIMIPVIYLSKGSYDDFIEIDESLRKSSVINWMIENDSRVEKFSTSTSVCVYNKNVYCSSGGNDEKFEGWGFEDLEFNLRLIKSSNKFSLPRKICSNFYGFNTVNKYKGWKSIYRLFGDVTFLKGIVLFHVWHPVEKTSDHISSCESKNEKKFIRSCSKRETDLNPLPDIYRGKTLLFSRTNPFVYNRSILPKLGEVLFEDEFSFTPSSLEKYLKEYEVSRILFHNPYANELRLGLYNKSLSIKGLEVVVAERGALRDSVFFDKNGFNASSSSYDKSHWDKPLSKEQCKLVSKYIGEEKKCNRSLEKQTQRRSNKEVVEKLGVSGKKVLFVPLQRPSDTVIKYFCGDIKSYNNFVNLVQDVANQLSKEWIVVVKQHPLEDVAPDLDNVVLSDYNVKDLIEISEAVLLINSGVGVLSMLWEKRVLYAGDVFYGDDRINQKVTTSTDVLDCLEEDFQPDQEAIFRFIYYLLFKFYSFGEFTTHEAPRENSRLTVTTEIKFYRIRMLGEELNLYIGPEPKISKKSILFDRYRGDKWLHTFSQEPSVFNNYQKVCIYTYILLSKPFMTEKQHLKLIHAPKEFFIDSKSKVSIVIGKFLKII